MASISAPSRTTLASLLLRPASLFASPAILRSASLASPQPTSPSLWETIQGLWDLLPPIVLAVPKKQTTHSRKRMRSLNKQLKPKSNINSCPGCGLPKLSHHLCTFCYSAITKSLKNEKRVRDFLGDEPEPLALRAAAVEGKEPLSVEAAKKD